MNELQYSKLLKLQQALQEATNSGLFDKLVGDIFYTDINRFCDSIQSAVLDQKAQSIYKIGEKFDFKVGDRVICNGYPGAVTAKIGGMVEVRLQNGSTCVTANYPDCYPAIVEEDRTDKLQDWTVRYGEQAMLFHCKAENIAHAIEQCENAYPDDSVVSAIADSVDSPLVYYWDAHCYTGCMPQPNAAAFVMQVIDKRLESGGLMIDVSPQGGHTDDIMSLSVEINRLPESEIDTQCVHLHFDTDNLAMSIFKQGLNKYILRPETGVKITSTVLPNGERAFLLE